MRVRAPRRCAGLDRAVAHRPGGRERKGGENEDAVGGGGRQEEDLAGGPAAELPRGVRDTHPALRGKDDRPARNGTHQQLAAALPRRAWQRLPAGPGAKGQRYYDWACLELPAPDRAGFGATGSGPGCWWLLIRRSRRTGELAFYRCYSPTPVRLIQLVAVAGRRWTVEECFQGSKGLAGLDEHQVRRWLPWRRWTLLAMLAHALLVVLAAGEHAAGPPPVGLVPLTCNELQRLLTCLVLDPARRPADSQAWSRWRRRHEYRARVSHYRRKTTGLA